MLKTPLLHPEILAALASSGHGARVLVADGNYPFSTGAAPAARRVYLNFAPGLLTVVNVLQILVAVMPVEAALLMGTPDGSEPEAHRDYRAILGAEVPATICTRHEFYGAARGADTCLVIATGETRRFANILLTIGVVR